MCLYGTGYVRIPLNYTPRNGICLGQITLRNAVPALPPTSKAQGLLFPHNLAGTCTAQLSDLCYSSSGNYKLCLDLHFSDYFLHVLTGPLGFLFGKLPFFPGSSVTTHMIPCLK